MPTNNWKHYAWWVVLGGFLTQVILLICIQTLPITLSMLEKSLSVTHAAAGTIVSVYGLCYAAFSFIWGYSADKIGARKTLALSGLVCSVGLISFGLCVNTLLSAIFLYGVVGFGAAGIYSATVPKLIGAWFVPTKQGKIMTIVTSGGVLSTVSLGIILPMLAVKGGWQNTFVLVGIITFIVTLIIFAVVRSNPSEKGLTPYGSPEGTPLEQPKPAVNLKDNNQFAIVAKKRITWHLSLFFIFFQFAYMIGTAFMSVTVVSAGFSVAQGGLAISLHSFATLFGMWIWGPLSDRLERKTVISIASLGWVIFAVLYTFVWGKSLALMYANIFCLGICVSMMPVILATFSEYFDPEFRGTANGVISTFALVGRFFGPLVAGIIADATGAITSVWGLAAVSMLLCCLTAYKLPKIRNIIKKDAPTIAG